MDATGRSGSSSSSVDGRRRLAIGLDVGVTNVKSAVVSEAGEVLRRDSTPTGSEEPTWPQRVRAHLEHLERELGAAPAAAAPAAAAAAAVGLAAPGIAHPSGTHIAWMQGRLAEVQGLDWSAFLGRSVPVLNDAQAALLGEAWLGAAAGATNAMLLTLGTGVGGALIVDGRLLRGHIGRAGHLGHVSLDPAGRPDITNCPGALEEAIGNVSIAERTGGRFATTFELVEAYRRGDVMATRVWLTGVRALAAAIASLVNVADPEVVIVGGGIATAGDALFRPLARFLDTFEWRPHGAAVRLARAALGEHAGAIGAARNALLLRSAIGNRQSTIP